MSKCILTTEFDFNDKSHKSFIINAVVGAKWHLDRISTVNDVAYNTVVKSIIDTLSNERSPILWGNAAINSVDSRSVLLEAINTLLTYYQNLGDRSLAKADLNILKNKLETFFPLKRFIPTTSDYEEDIDEEEQLIDEDKPASRMPELVQAPTAETLTASSTDTSDIKLKTILNEVYGENRSAISQLDSIFKRYIFDYLIADRNQGNFIFNRTELNTNIINLKNRLWKTLIEYLKVHDPNFKANTVALNTGYLFSQLGKLNEDYQKVLDLAYAYISTVGHEQVSAEYIKSLTADSPILNGIHAFVMLQKFDALLDLHLDKNVKILPKYMNREVEDRTKYFFSVSSSHKVHGWQEGDERTSIQNTSKLIQFVINSIPLEINGEDTGRNISVNLLSATITHLMAKAPYIQTTNPLFQELQALLRSRHTSVHKNTVPILKIIYDVTTGPSQDNIEFKNILKKDLGLRDQEIGVLNSLYKYVFAIDESDYDYIQDGNSIKEKRWEDFKYQSLASIELYLLKKGQISRDTYSYSHDIANFINNSMDISYLESEYSSDGKLSVGIRKKAPTRKMAFNFANSVNGLLIGLSQEARQKLMGKYPIEHNKSNLFQASTISLTPNILQSGVRITYTADRNRPLGIFNYVNTSTITIELPEGATKSSLSTLLSDGDRMMKTINDYNAEQTEKFTITQRVAIDLLSFFDDTLGTKFLSLDGINLLNIFKSLYDSNYLEELSLFALKNAVSNQIYKNYSERSDANTSFKQYVLDLDPGFNNIDRIEHSKFFIINNGIYKLRIIPDNISWVSTYAEAQAIQSGKSNPSVTKDFSDNHVPNYVSAFLGGQIDNLQYLNEEAAARRRQEQAENPILPNLASETLLPFSNQKILKGYVVEADVKTLDGTTKKVVDMTPSEAVYHYILHNFWSRYIETGEIASQATTYSDKPKLVLYLTDLNAKGLLDGKTKYINYTFKEVVEEFSSSIGMSCKNRLDNVLYHYMRLMGINELPTVQQVEEFLWDKSERELAILAQKVGIEIHPDLHYRKINDKLRFNSLLTYQAKWASPEAVVPVLLEQKRQYINGIISSRANFYVTGHSETLLGVASKDLDLL